MALATWWQNDPLPELASLPTFSARLSHDIQQIALLTQLPPEEVEDRLQQGNLCYIAYMKDIPVAYGWIATQEAGIQAIHVAFTVTPPNCYLWSFTTLPEWRGQGIYTHFLHEILRQQAANFRYIWIGFEPGNTIAQRAMIKAGFQFVSDFVVVDEHAIGLTLFTHDEKALASAAFFNLPVIADEQA